MRYPKAPIQEAVFDIKVDNVKNNDIDYYMSLTKTRLSDFPKAEKQLVVSGRLKFDKIKHDITSDQKTKSVIGVIYSKEEGNIKIQFRKDGFSLNMLKPYSEWSEFSSLAFKYWEIYRKEIKPNNINRIALRYINKIELPLKGLDLRQYLNHLPVLPDVFEKSYDDFFFKATLKCKESGNPVILIERTAGRNENHLSFIIDIDAFKNKDINYQNVNEEFEILRNNKNDIFESLITNKTRELFK